MISCKKENAKDDSGFIKDKTWWGDFAYFGRTREQYSVHFNGDNTLTWSERSGDYPGKWTMNGRHLAISVNGNSVKAEADISNDGKLESITNKTDNSEISSGPWIANPKIAVENTVWKGSYGPSSDYQLSFLDGSKMKSKYLMSGVEDLYTYERSASGAVIRYGLRTNSNYLFMGIIISANEMKGNDDGYRRLVLVKQ